MKEKNKIPGIVQILIILYVLRAALPVWGFYMPAVVNVILFSCLYLAVFIGKLRLQVKDLLLMVPVFSVEILSLFYEIPSDIATYVYGMLQLIMYPLLGLYLIKSNDSKAARRIFYVVSLAYLVTCVTTYWGCKVYPTASRMLATTIAVDDPELYSLYVSMNIGGFFFVYTIVLMLPLFIYLIRVKRINFIIGILALLLVAFTVLITEYATAMLFTVVAFMAFIFPQKFGLKHIMTTVFVVFIVYLIAKDYIVYTFETVASNVESEILAERLNSLADVFHGEKNIYGDLENRFGTYTKSIDAFNASPIWGGSGKEDGGHSFLLDNMGKYGILGIIAMIFMYNSIYKLFYKRFKSQDYWGYISLSFLTALAFAIINPQEMLNYLTFLGPVFMVAFKTDRIKI